MICAKSDRMRAGATLPEWCGTVERRTQCPKALPSPHQGPLLGMLTTMKRGGGLHLLAQFGITSDVETPDCYRATELGQ